MKKRRRDQMGLMDYVILVFLAAGALTILFPVFNVLAVSFTTNKEYLESAWVFWPKKLTLEAYRTILSDKRIFIGYKTTVVYVLLGVPLNIILDSCMAYAFTCKDWPGKRLILILVLLTMIFNGGIVPTYLVVKQLGLTNTIWSVILTGGMSTFNMILIMNYFNSLPESLNESARLDGASELTILFRIVLPLSKPILATVCLFVMVQFWNEYFGSMIYIRSDKWSSLQQVLRSIVIESQISDIQMKMTEAMQKTTFQEGIKMAAVVVTMLPIMCVYPFLQKYFIKGVTIGAIKA